MLFHRSKRKLNTLKRFFRQIKIQKRSKCIFSFKDKNISNVRKKTITPRVVMNIQNSRWVTFKSHIAAFISLLSSHLISAKMNWTDTEMDTVRCSVRFSSDETGWDEMRWYKIRWMMWTLLRAEESRRPETKPKIGSLNTANSLPEKKQKKLVDKWS